jgi:uncharacterized protein YjlB
MKGMATTLAPRVALHRFADDGRIPNNPRLPLVVYEGALADDGDMASACERLFHRNGWGDGWRNGIFPYHHFHSTAHEALGIVRGSARVQFGGEAGATLDVSAGDVVVIPAGVGHKRLSGSRDLLVIGAYPRGQAADLRKGDPAEIAEVRANVAKVPLPSQDPVLGAEGPVVDRWRKA